MALGADESLVSLLKLSVTSVIPSVANLALGADGLLVSLLKLSVTSVILSVTNGFGSGWVIVESLEIIRYICYSIRC